MAQQYVVSLVEGALGTELELLDQQLRDWLRAGVLAHDGPVRTEAKTRALVAGIRAGQEKRE